jgi:glyoxylase-like metal-dependent hydrolase (beta-lactamase superfamily II)
MDLVSFRTPGLGDQTYLLIHEGMGLLVDPQRDIDRFLAVAAERDVDLRFVLETHLHNDYVSGGEQAALRTGAELVLPAAAAAAYPHTPAFHNEEIKGSSGLTIRPIHTPGHTPEHTSYLVLVDGEPAALFSGGSLLVASAGRPDLLGPERARTLARLQYGSLHRLAGLPRDVGLYPTHGEGSFCTASGAGIGAERYAGGMDIVIRAEGTRIVLDPELRRVLTGAEAEGDLAPRAAAAWLAQSLVAEGGGQIQLADDEDGVLLLGASLRF